MAAQSTPMAGAAARRPVSARLIAAVLLSGCGIAAGPSVAAEVSPNLGAQPLVAQAGPVPPLPSLVLPPAAKAGPPTFASLMQTGDAAILHGDVDRARALYRSAAKVYPESAAALLAAGKTYDPAILSSLGITRGDAADAAKARDLYEQARRLGDPTAVDLLTRLP